MNPQTTEIKTITDFLERALNSRKGKSPYNLHKIITDHAEYDQISLPVNILDIIVSHIESCDVNDRILDELTIAIQAWDNVENPSWSLNTTPFSEQRREIILNLLGFDFDQQKIINSRVLRFSETEIPIVIAEQHTPWYEERKKFIKFYYWNDYVRQLRLPKGTWDAISVGSLDASTDDVLSRLSDPSASNVYPVKGLVVGYVQSGKTSHFNGLIAKAADAGYRLIIILSGTTDILRKQTQRRIDKDIIGHDIIDVNEYGSDNDWSQFVDHEVSIQNGRYEWERLTTKEEYRSLRHHPSLLEFKRHYPDLPLNHEDNLRYTKARIAIIKKVPVVINKLIRDFSTIDKFKSKLDNVPTLIIDDESDQASINTIDQSKPGSEGERTKTNKAIGELLKLLPRAQYVGYTATPFANVFIDPEDAEDLFPKDFIISLPRPQGYMGGSDFYDFTEEYEEGDYHSNKNAFVRPVEGHDEDSENLPKAIDSFVLSGAIKLYRQKYDPDHYRFKHHTMLLHHAAKQIVHDEDKIVVENIFDGGSRYSSAIGLSKLQELFENDFLPVSMVRATDAPFPKTFDELNPFITDCISRISYEKPVRIINCSKTGSIDEPDFEQGDVWTILVGGTKLSRGYTVEGLTTSYYRRPTGAGDTLMQMGRWFGFRRGYKDLVRLFIGVNERRGKVPMDLYKAFESIVKSEDELRGELQKYSTKGLLPKQVPPLVRQFLPLLPPTSKNKMFNAVIKSQDFSGEYKEKVAASSFKDKKFNQEICKELISKTNFENPIQTFQFLNNKRQPKKFVAYLGAVSGEDILSFLGGYLWVDGNKPLYLEIEYIKKCLINGELGNWQLLIPQLNYKNSIKFTGTKLGPLTTIERKLTFKNTFEVYSEPRHREAASYLAGVDDVIQPSSIMVEKRDKTTPVMILYFAIPKGNPSADITVGFGIQYPGIRKDYSLVWGVNDSNNADLIVVDTEAK